MPGLAVWARRVTSVCVVGGVLALALPGPDGALPSADAASCPKDMASIGGDFCIDRYEGRTVEVRVPRRGGKPTVIQEHSPFEPVDGVDVMAVVAKGRVPQGYISREQADAACRLAGKRLCTDEEWLRACRGKKPTKFPYGDSHVEGRCNDKGVSSFNRLFGPGDGGPPPQSAYDTQNMNDPRLNKMKGTVAVSGKFHRLEQCHLWCVRDVAVFHFPHSSGAGEPARSSCSCMYSLSRSLTACQSRWKSSATSLTVASRQ